MGRSDPRNVCDGCGQSFDRRLRSYVVLGPVVHERVWQKLASDPRECLCAACMSLRAHYRLRRRLKLADLRPCAWNLVDRPYSWFDLFVEMEVKPPRNLAQWRTIAREHGIAPP